MEKYYDLIISLIKANRKYPGCESIVEDIVADVYAHAEVVLNTVTNENVITSYLNKIVTTSMITVPRRLGIKTGSRAENHGSSINIQELIQKTEQSTMGEINSSADSVSDSIEEPLNIETDEQEISSSNEVLESEPADIDNESAVEELAYDNDDQDYTLTEDNDTNVKSSVPDVDQSLVEKMINGVSHQDIENNSEALSEETLDIEPDCFSEIDNMEEDEIEPLDDNFEEDFNLVQESDNLDKILETEIIANDFEEDEFNELPDGENSEEESDEESLEIDFEEESDVLIDGEESKEIDCEKLPEIDLEEPSGSYVDGVASEELSDGNTLGVDLDGAEVDESNTEYSETMPVYEPLEIGFEEESDALLEEEHSEETVDEGSLGFGLGEEESNELIDERNPEENFEIGTELNELSSESDFSGKINPALLYKNFEFTPQNSKPNLDEVYKLLGEFKMNQQNIDVVTLLKLKYKDKLSISEISAKLGLPEDVVLQTFSEIADVVKEQ